MSENISSAYLHFFETSWGSHLCHFYKTKEDLLEILVPYFIDGLNAGEACIWVVADPLGLDEARDALGAAAGGLDNLERNGQLEFISYRDWYLDGGSGTLKSSDSVLRGWLQKEAKALRSGFSGIRITGNVHFLTKHEDWKHFVNYEHSVGQDIHLFKIKAICSYPIDQITDPVFISDAVLNHQSVLIRRDGQWSFCENPEHRAKKKVEDHERNLKSLTTKLASSNTELARFAYVASHDLKEPLRMISCYTDLLKQRYEGKFDVEADDFLRYAQEGALRAQRLIDDLLEFSRVDQVERKFERVDCNRVLETALENLRLSIQESSARITSDILPEIEGDEGLLRQLFQNLVSNAIKFRNGEVPRVRISSKTDGKEWIFSVKDNGIGIGREFQDRLFLIFQRLHHKDEYPGTGIGLALCKKIVEKHSGRIWVESEKGEGSEFFFAFPAKVGATAERRPAQPTWRSLLEEQQSGRHIVHIYEEKETLEKTVSRFISHGLEQNEGVLLVARPEHAELFLQAVRAAGADPEAAIEKGQLVIRDAENVLSSFMTDGQPQWTAFEKNVGGLVREVLQNHLKLRVYGEMVDTLCAKGNLAAALTLEQYWNSLGKRLPFSLLCAYHSNHVPGESTSEFASPLQSVCKSHSHTISRVSVV